MGTTAAARQAAPYDASATAAREGTTGRIDSLDFVRGIVMILMAIDHVRVYAGVPAGGPDPGVFFTRWVTHFVAPGFVFLAGTSAYLHGRNLGDRAALAKFLVTRGAWLVLLELTVIRVAWTFNLDFANYMLAGVIWMLGWCMILLAVAIHLPMRAIAITGVAIVALHNVTDFFAESFERAFGEAGPPWILKFLYAGGGVQLGGDGGPPLLILYVLVPWIGVMMAGYAFGRVMELPPQTRRSLCLKLGLGLTALFVALRVTRVYGDPNPWNGGASLQFLATAKYPASLQFLLMTLGPLVVLLGLAEGWRGKVARVATTFGRVPFFYYLLHIPLIHVAAMVVSLVREGSVNPWLFGNHPMNPPPVPDGYRWSLGLLYLVFAISVALLYFPCRWWAGVREGKRSRWLSYL